MKKLKINKCLLILFALLTIFVFRVKAQEDKVEQKKIVNLHYFNSNNSLQYLLLESILKTGKKLEPQKNKAFQIYLDSNKAENLITKALTDDNGKIKAIIPPQLKNVWDGSAQHKFIVVAEKTSKEEETTSEFTITKAKISIDTSSADGVKSISAQVMKYENNQWVPAKDVEMKMGVERLGGILSAGDEPTYTTDSTGIATSEFKKDSLPGQQGNLILIAKVEDNDELGNLIVEKTVPWGIAIKQDNNFFKQRTLWSTRFRTPLWLLFMAYSIVIGVWGTLIYLVFQVIKIKRLGAVSSGG
jgi:hypothetical protein